MLVLGQFGNLEEGVYEVRGTWRGEAAVTCEAWQAQSTCLAFQLQSYTDKLSLYVICGFLRRTYNEFGILGNLT